ncbi:MAG TPA: transcription termination/antitermination NusG family protein [Aggregatilineaceae bacterium]|jgi:transcriptional antiterminator RfaH|nr:transcription termination/antitermination NusG family protein [Aggregatilineaceae bacterium]
MSTSAWYVLHSKPHKENQINAYLQSQNLETFYPTLRVQPVNPRASKIRPYFPGYLFVRADLDAVGVSALQWIPGAVGLVSFDGQPGTVPDYVIRELRQRIAEIEAAGGLTLDGLKQGDPVRITHGPFAGYEAIFDMRLSGAERVQVLLQMLGRLVKVQVTASEIEKRRVK